MIDLVAALAVLGCWLFFVALVWQHRADCPCQGRLLGVCWFCVSLVVLMGAIALPVAWVALRRAMGT